MNPIDKIHEVRIIPIFWDDILKTWFDNAIFKLKCQHICCFRKGLVNTHRINRIPSPWRRKQWRLQLSRVATISSEAPCTENVFNAWWNDSNYNCSDKTNCNQKGYIFPECPDASKKSYEKNDYSADYQQRDWVKCWICEKTDIIYIAFLNSCPYPNANQHRPCKLQIQIKIQWLVLIAIGSVITDPK